MKKIEQHRHFKKLKWTRIKKSFMNKSFGESMSKETKRNILKYSQEKLF